MVDKIRFRNYGQYSAYVTVKVKKLDLALPKEVIGNEVAQEEIQRLKLTTWEYDKNDKTCIGTFYWNGGEKAWKYYEKEELLGILIDCDEPKAAKILENYLDDPANDDDGYPEFTEEEDEE